MNPDISSDISDDMASRPVKGSRSFTRTVKARVDEDNVLAVTSIFSNSRTSEKIRAAKAKEAERLKGIDETADAQALQIRSSLSTKLKESNKEVRKIRFPDQDTKQLPKGSSTKTSAGRAKQSPTKHRSSLSSAKQIADKYRPGNLKQPLDSETDEDGEMKKISRPSKAKDDEIKESEVHKIGKTSRSSKATAGKIKKTPRSSKGPDDGLGGEEKTTASGANLKRDVTGDNDKEKADSKTPKQTRKRTVTVQVIFYRFRDINTSAETYDAEIIINARWPEPEFDESKKLPDRTMEVDEYKWSPELNVENSIRDMKVISQSVTLQYAESGNAFVTQSTKYFGKFSESMELRDFPFDIQRMSLLVRTERPPSEVSLKFSPEAPHLVRKSLYFQEQQFRLYMHVISEDLSAKPYDEYGSVKTSEELRVSCLMARNSVFYINNCYLIALLLSLLGFVSFAPDVQFTMQRNVLSLFVTLSALSHKYTLIPHIPKTSYMTHADRYCLTVIFCLLLMSVWQAIMTLVDVRKRNMLDLIGVIIFGEMFLLFNIATWLPILHWTFKTRKKLNENEKKYTAKLKILRDEKVAINNEMLE